MPKQQPLLAAEDDFDPEPQEPEYEDVQEELEEGQTTSPLPYPEIVLNTTLNNNAGEWIEVRVQGYGFSNVMTNFAALVQNLTAEFGVTMAKPTTQSGAQHQAPVPRSAPGAPSATAQSGRSTPGAAVMPLERIAVVPRDNGGYVTQFKVKPFKWPLQCFFDAEGTAGLFDDELGWLPEHFDGVAEYQGSAVDGLYLLWVEETNAKTNKTYKNVKRVSADKEALEQMIGG